MDRPCCFTLFSIPSVHAISPKVTERWACGGLSVYRTYSRSHLYYHITHSFLTFLLCYFSMSVNILVWRMGILIKYTLLID